MLRKKGNCELKKKTERTCPASSTGGRPGGQGGRPGGPAGGPQAGGGGGAGRIRIRMEPLPFGCCVRLQN